MSKRVKAAILGSGFIGRVHVEALCRLGFVKICALVARDRDHAEHLARDYGVEQDRDGLPRVLEDPSFKSCTSAPPPPCTTRW